MNPNSKAMASRQRNSVSSRTASWPLVAPHTFRMASSRMRRGMRPARKEQVLASTARIINALMATKSFRKVVRTGCSTE